MNTNTGEIYDFGEKVDQQRALLAMSKGDNVVPVSEEVAQLVHDGRAHRKQKEARRRRNKAARAARRKNR